MIRLPWMLEAASNGDREWLVIGFIVLLLLLRHAVIVFLSRSDRRR
jgi:hypothetical protein